MTQAYDGLTDILRSRHSCRAYLPDALPRSEIEAVLKAAQMVPSWCNSQPWQVHVTDKPETDRLADALYEHAQKTSHNSDIDFPDRYEGAYKDRRRECGWQLYDAVGVQKGDRAASAAQMMENFRLFGAPHFMLVTTPKALGAYGVLDCGAFVTAVTLAAAARGFGSLPMAAVASYSPFLRDWFEVDAERDILCGIIIGHADQAHPANKFRTNRAGLDEVAIWR